MNTSEGRSKEHAVKHSPHPSRVWGPHYPMVPPHRYSSAPLLHTLHIPLPSLSSLSHLFPHQFYEYTIHSLIMSLNITLVPFFLFRSNFILQLYFKIQYKHLNFIPFHFSVFIYFKFYFLSIDSFCFQLSPLIYKLLKCFLLFNINNQDVSE